MISKTHTLYIEYSYIYVDISTALYKHIYTHTQNEWNYIRHNSGERSDSLRDGDKGRATVTLSLRALYCLRKY